MSQAATDSFNGGSRLLALCPLLAVTDRLLSALALAIIVAAVVTLSILIMVLVRRRLTGPLLPAASMLVVASLSAAAHLVLGACSPGLRDALGVFLALLVANLAVLQHVQVINMPAIAALRSGAAMSLDLGLMLLLLGGTRELVGHGSLLHDVGQILGDWAQPAQQLLVGLDTPWRLAVLPPGAFIAAGLLLAARNWLGR